MSKRARVTIVVAAVVGTGVMAAVVSLGVSYVTSFGDQTRPGVRAARKLGIRP